MRWIDDIRVFCPCMEPIDASNDNASSLPDTGHDGEVIPKTINNDLALHQLEYLYFCNYCLGIRCQMCVEEEVVSRFCPNCLYEVSEESAHSDGNRCFRNCMCCPICPSKPILVVEASESDDERSYNLVCRKCHYTSQNNGIALGKKGSLASQVYEASFRSRESRFNKLREYYVEKSLPIKHKTPASIDTKPLTGDSKDSVYPILCKLRSKRSKRCVGCRHLLIKPDKKPTSIQYRIKLMAMDILPSMRILLEPDQEESSDPKLEPQLQPNKMYHCQLVVKNPQRVHMGVNVSVLPGHLSEDYPHQVTLLSQPDVKLGPCPELWDEESLLLGSVPSEITRKSNVFKRLKMEGKLGSNVGSLNVSSIGTNWVSLSFELVPSSNAKHCKVPLFISISYDTDDQPVKVGLWIVANLGEVAGT